MTTSVPASTSSSAFSLLETQAPPVPAPQPTQPPAAPRLTSYTAYTKNELKITLTPQTSAARPGVVNIMARFQVTGSNVASGLNFQAAVPKASCFVEYAIISDELMLSVVATVANVTDVESRHSTWCYRVAADARDRPTWCKCLMGTVALPAHAHHRQMSD